MNMFSPALFSDLKLISTLTVETVNSLRLNAVCAFTKENKNKNPISELAVTDNNLY